MQEKKLILLGKENMKIFRVYSKIHEYLVFKCPHCNSVFRSQPQDKIFGKEKINTKCIVCEENFKFKDNQLEEDPLPKNWQCDREMIMKKPNGEIIFFLKDKIKVPEIKPANKIK